ncbi:MAG: dTMP kinase [Thermoguttaceae bacterium]|nr:dTMP kinase [Thermoguttaceae bacterium]MDW8037680.1 dTMP kinase [Thermoguttaceae bacterium]
MFIALDGGDGVGKSTQVALLADWLGQLGYSVVVCRDPGSTRLGEAIRSLLLDRQDLQLVLKAEMLLYMAARAQMVEELIRPALAAGQTVISDRYLLANVVYQGYGGGLDVDSLWQIGQLATGGLMPELTIVLDVPVEVALSRLTGKPDRIEARSRQFHEQVRQGFLQEARLKPNQIVVIEATGSIPEVHLKIQQLLRQRGLVGQPSTPIAGHERNK